MSKQIREQIQEIERKINAITFRLQCLEYGLERKCSKETIAKEISEKFEELRENRPIPCEPSKKETPLAKSVTEKRKDLSIVEKYIKTLSSPCIRDDYLQVKKDLHERMEARGTDFCVDGRVLLAAFEIESKKKKNQK